MVNKYVLLTAFVTINQILCAFDGSMKNNTKKTLRKSMDGIFLEKVNDYMEIQCWCFIFDFLRALKRILDLPIWIQICAI